MATGNVGERDIEINLKFKTVLSCTLAFIMAGEPCAFDKLFNRSLPSVLEKIFLSLDSASLKKCREVCKAWNGMIKTEPFQRKLQEMRDNEKKLLDYLYDGTNPTMMPRFGTLTIDLPSVKEQVSRFLSLGVDVNCRRGWQTPLALATRARHLEVVELLLAEGADPNYNYSDKSLLAWSVLYHKPRMVQLLLDAGARANEAHEGGKSPLQCASAIGNKVTTYIKALSSMSLNCM